ncbi:MAG: C40 family peptidase [Sulfuricurvum sp.]|nr:C40 family peptidase [Sulfuricurvum sp.]
MLIRRTVLSLILLTLAAQADSQRREPSLFLEYERELKKANDSVKPEENPFNRNNTPLSIAKPVISTLQPIKTTSTTDSSSSKNSSDSIGADSSPFLVINKPAPIADALSCPENANTFTQIKTPKSIIHNIRTAKDKILAKAKAFLGTPYSFGGRSSEQTDCSGFTQQVYGQLGISLPHSATEQALLGEKVDPNDLQVGDLLFYRTYKSDPSHVAIYAGDGQIIHASFNSRRVQYDSIDKGYYKQHFLYARRLALNTQDTDTQ